MEKLSFARKEGSEPYQYFKHKEQREDIYQFSRGVTKYLHDKKVPNIILLDRSPRPLWIGIDEYWKNHYQKEERPNIYFINPDAFDVFQKIISEEKLSQEYLAFDQLVFERTGSSEMVEKVDLRQEKMVEEFRKIYSNLEKDKNKPLAIFDNCIHSGATMIPVLHYLGKNGYGDIRILIGETSNDRSPVKITKDFTNKVQLVSCGAFGRDFGVDKDSDGMLSKYDKNANREKVIRSREEIRRIVREEGKK